MTTRFLSSIFGWFFLCHFILLHPSLQANEFHHDFIVITPEKTGTHLLTKTMEKLTGKQTHYYWNHSVDQMTLLAILHQAKQQNAFVQMHAIPDPIMIWTLMQQNYKVIFLIRDPRDQAVSLLFYILKGWSYGPLNMQMPFGQLSVGEQLDEVITGVRYGCSGTFNIMINRLPWMFQDPHFALTARFENLVGEEGGGSREKQLIEVSRIAQHIHLNISAEEIEKRSEGLFGKPGEGTFRSGQIGEWKKYFTPIHIQRFKQLFGAHLIQLGYEKDLNWPVPSTEK